MKRANGKRKAAEGWARMGDAVDLLDGASAAFLVLSRDAARLATGEGLRGEWGPGGAFARTARAAAEYAEANPDRHPDFPDPLAELSGMLDALARLAATSAKGGRLETFARLAAVDLAARARMLYAVAGMRLDAMFDRERVRAEGAAKVAAARAELAEVKGDKAAFRKWKREEKTELEAWRVLHVAHLLGTAGWTVEQVAESMRKRGLKASTSVLNFK